MTGDDPRPTAGAVALGRLVVELLAIEGIAVSAVQMQAGEVVIRVDPRAPAKREGGIRTP